MQQYLKNAARVYAGAAAQFNHKGRALARSRTINYQPAACHEGCIIWSYKQLQLEGKTDNEIRQNFETPEAGAFLPLHVAQLIHYKPM